MISLYGLISPGILLHLAPANVCFCLCCSDGQIFSFGELTFEVALISIRLVLLLHEAQRLLEASFEELWLQSLSTIISSALSS
jgi:hypothetical protein